VEYRDLATAAKMLRVEVMQKGSASRVGTMREEVTTQAGVASKRAEKKMEATLQERVAGEVGSTSRVGTSVGIGKQTPVDCSDLTQALLIPAQSQQRPDRLDP